MESMRDQSVNTSNTHNDRSGEIILKSTGIAYVVIFAGWLLLAPQMDLIWRLWVPFLLANLVVWVGILGVAAIKSVVEGYRSTAPLVAKVSHAVRKPAPVTEADRPVTERISLALTRVLSIAR
jgi:hypothetical protein